MEKESSARLFFTFSYLIVCPVFELLRDVDKLHCPWDHARTGVIAIGVGQPLLLPRPMPTHLHKVSRQGQDSPGSLIPTGQEPVGLFIWWWRKWGVLRDR